MKKFLEILVWILTIGAIIAGWTLTHKEHVEQPLNDVELTLKRENTTGFIDYDMVYNDVLNICDTVNNTEIAMIPLDSVRNYLKTIPWAVSTEADLSLENNLVVNVVECQPIMRVFNKNGKSVYIDADGIIYPTSNDCVRHLPIGNGNLDFPVVTNTSSSVYDEKYKNTDLWEVYSVMKSVLDNSYTNCCVKQVYRGKNGDYELAMNNVNQKVILGLPENVDLKLKNLQYFFEKMQGNPDLELYCKVNFNFENQVVCTKKNKVK